jgi:2-polyprenyl-6-methoxyphenol hydroxylase-like FAD-dependent oxidoreductase
MGWSEWYPAALRECGGDFLVAAYGDVCALLRAAARSEGVALRYGARVLRVLDGPGARVTLDGGEEVAADVLVGADGAGGVTRAPAPPPPADGLVTFKCARRSLLSRIH